MENQWKAHCIFFPIFSQLRRTIFDFLLVDCDAEGWIPISFIMYRQQKAHCTHFPNFHRIVTLISASCTLRSCAFYFPISSLKGVGSVNKGLVSIWASQLTYPRTITSPFEMDSILSLDLMNVHYICINYEYGVN